MTLIKSYDDLSSKFIEIQEYQIHYIEYGEGDQTYLLLHGNPTSSFVWRNIIKNIHTSIGGHFVAPDLLGFGRSDKPVKISDYSFELHYKIIREFIQILDLRNITLVVHDWGGAIGFTCAVNDQDRYRNFVVLNTFTTPVSHIPRWFRFLTRLPIITNFLILRLKLFQWIAFNFVVKLSSQRYVYPISP